MKNDEHINLRLPSALRRALERERKRVSRAFGTEVKSSAVIRAILEKALRTRRTDSAAA